MRIVPTRLDGVLVVEPRVFGDHRGFFLEAWRREAYAEHGIGADFVQDNVSFSQRGVLRGLHFQAPSPQGKLVTALSGSVYDVAVDIRRGSPSYGEWAAVELSGENHRQLWIPPGFAHGFQVTSDSSLISYKCTTYYRPDADRALRWDDPDLGIPWPVAQPGLSAKDAAAPRLREIAPVPVASPQSDDARGGD